MAQIRRFAPRYPAFADRFFDEDLRDWFRGNFSPTDTTVPAVNVKETENEFQIELAAPGMDKKDFNINLENSTLTVSSEHKEEAREEDENFTRKEFSYQSFQRSFNIPENMVDGDKIDAKYKDGILHIKLPKLEHAKPKPARNIKIS
jgi:HSP20 family protein